MACCVVCGKERQPNPAVEDGWHILETARGDFPVCPKHAPPNSATREERRQAFITLFKRIYAEGSRP